MTVKQLKQLISQFPDDMEIGFNQLDTEENPYVIGRVDTVMLEDAAGAPLPVAVLLPCRHLPTDKTPQA